MNQVRGIANEEKSLCIYENTEDGRIYTYTKEAGYQYITHEQFTELRKKPRSATHLLIKRNTKDDDIKHLSMRKQLKAITLEAEVLKIITKERINLFKTGSVAKTGLQLFYSMCKVIPEQITALEAEVFESCYLGALIYGIPYKGKAYKYDVCSEYPSILRSEHMQFPIGEGTFTTFNQEEVKQMKYFKYGIYHIEIKNADFRLFKTNNKNWYTHIDVNRAIELKYELIIIMDDKPNALLYEGKLMNGAKLFREFIDYLFEYKNKKFSCVKKYINVVAGALCQTDSMTMNTSKNDKDKLPTEIFEGKEIITMMPLGNEVNSISLQMETVIKDKRYDTNFARIKPFLVAKGRYMISKIIEKNIEKVVYCHTDGIVLKKRIKDVKLGTNIGDLKFEEKSKCCEIINGTKKLGFTKESTDVFVKLKEQLKRAKEIN